MVNIAFQASQRKLMINKRNLIYIAVILLLIFSRQIIFAQKNIPENFCISVQEKLLFDQLNQLIEDYGKEKLAYSASLSYVAKTHVNDLLQNHPDTRICNLSSWSDKGDWTACCHNAYVPQQDCMWDKPKELTQYPYRGYEIAGYFEDAFTVDSVIKLWSGTKEVLDMLLTDGNFQSKKWTCMGVGLNAKYVSVWFGQRSDKLNRIELCNDTLLVSDKSNKSKSEEIFYIIFGSYLNTRDAKEAIKRLNKNSFDNAGILKSNNKIRVYLDKFSTIKEAVVYKQNLPYTYREAWVYKE